MVTADFPWLASQQLGFASTMQTAAIGIRGIRVQVHEVGVQPRQGLVLFY